MGGLCGYKAHEFQRDADAFPNDSVFTAQGVEIATFHDSKAATDLNSANSVRSLWQRGDAFLQNGLSQLQMLVFTERRRNPVEKSRYPFWLRQAEKVRTRDHSY